MTDSEAAEILALTAFARMSPEDANELLHPVCASFTWADAVVAKRPYESIAALTAESDRLIAVLPWDELKVALAAHPRIGERVSAKGLDAAWSEEEQSTAEASAEGVEDELRQANMDYEDRFGHVFLISASGRAASDILTECHRRLSNEPADEQFEVRRELAAIVRLRLARVLG
jgi:2-oxo-4-hydroxy-4-carboxy-5-ureidoimidazoline decarboxylase